MPKQSGWKLACALVVAASAIVGLTPAAFAKTQQPSKPRVPDPVAILAKQTLDALALSNASPLPETASPDGGSLFSAAVEGITDAQYGALRSLLASDVASRVQSVDAATLDAAWASTSTARMTVILSALSQIGTPYHWGAEQPDQAFDCSGLTQWSWAQAGVTLSRSAWSQIHTVKRRTQAQLLAGDLVYHYDHISMYLGAGNVVINAPQHGKVVEVRDWRRETRFGSPLG